jgi:hypothetical protein
MRGDSETAEMTAQAGPALPLYSPDAPSIGRVVHYVDHDGHTWPAIIVFVYDNNSSTHFEQEAVDLKVFRNYHGDETRREVVHDSGTEISEPEAVHAKAHRANTWHWWND